VISQNTVVGTQVQPGTPVNIEYSLGATLELLSFLPDNYFVVGQDQVISLQFNHPIKTQSLSLPGILLRNCSQANWQASALSHDTLMITPSSSWPIAG